MKLYTTILSLSILFIWLPRAHAGEIMQDLMSNGLDILQQLSQETTESQIQ
jgi:hypothetical protein